jgi:thiol-disulfide isomerase/thioredoxin
MKNKFYLFLLLGVLLLLCACEENSQTQKSIVTYENIKPKLPKQKIVVKKEIPKPPKVYHFQFEDLDEQQINIEIKNNIYSFLEFSESIVLINIFATWCPPCVGQIPHLNKLQSKYRDKLFILGTLIHDEPLKDEKLRVFIESQKINFFIAKKQSMNMKFIDFIAPKLQLPHNFPLPVMILFVKGRYYTHYEGSIPEEMIESDIKQALNKIGE